MNYVAPLGGSDKVRAAHELMNDFGLRYGASPSYDSLISPSSYVIDAKCVDGLEEDLAAFWEYARVLDGLYLAVLDGSGPDWIRSFAESGHTPAEVSSTRDVARAGLLPLFCRGDYVSLGPRRAVAEVQWKSGGPGLFLLLQTVFDTLSDSFGGVGKRLSDPIARFADYLKIRNSNDPGVVVNDVREMWLPSEHAFSLALKEHGLEYTPVLRDDLVDELRIHARRLTLGSTAATVRVLIGQEFTTKIEPEMMAILSRMALNADIWVETPLSIIYKQKWGMALPFHADFSSLFSDSVRRVFIPTCLIDRSGKVVLDPLLHYGSSDLPTQLGDVRTLQDLPQLPTSARRRLVLKCGAGAGQYYNRARGVFRLTGARSNAERCVSLVSERISAGEPWIVQEYIDDTERVPLAFPADPYAVSDYECHGRYMIFGARNDSFNGPQYEVFGGLANWARHWKVSGKSAAQTDAGLTGSAFSGIRLEATV